MKFLPTIAIVYTASYLASATWGHLGLSIPFLVSWFVLAKIFRGSARTAYKTATLGLLVFAFPNGELLKALDALNSNVLVFLVSGLLGLVLYARARSENDDEGKRKKYYKRDSKQVVEADKGDIRPTAGRPKEAASYKSNYRRDALLSKKATEGEKIWLKVPYAEKDHARNLGAFWDAAQKRWFVPAGVHTSPFWRWL